jgi:glycyl-tRNA synthetase
MLGLPDSDRETLKRAAHLCKADLAAQMVVEFTALQGIMGAEYARRSGESEAVATAIAEHYLPAGSGDALPETGPGLALGIANRLDSLAGLIGVGLAPTGSADPFALRREALGLVTILLEKGLDFSVRAGLEKAAALMPLDIKPEAIAEADAFVQRRLEGLLRERGYAHDVVQAVLAERGHNPALALAAAEDLTKAIRPTQVIKLDSMESEAEIGEPDIIPWEELLDSYARCVRIVRNIDEHYELHPELFSEPAEKALYEAYLKVQSRLSGNATAADAIAAIRELLVDPITTFFDDVLVMVDDETIRNNRLALMQAIRDLTKGFADLSQLQGF